MSYYNLVTRLICALLTFYIHTAVAVRCYQCDSTTHLGCAQEFDYHNSGIEPTDCDDLYEARYCVKTIGLFGGIPGTTRFCTSRDMGNYCRLIKKSSDNIEYRACVFTCYHDECNFARGLTFSLLLFGFMIVLHLWL